MSRVNVERRVKYRHNVIIPRDTIEPEGFLEYSIDSQGGVELDAYIPPSGEAEDEASNVD